MGGLVGIFSEPSERYQKCGKLVDGNMIYGIEGYEERGYKKKGRKKKWFVKSEYARMVMNFGFGYLKF